jgi:hypothetical protein
VESLNLEEYKNSNNNNPEDGEKQTMTSSEYKLEESLEKKDLGELIGYSMNILKQIPKSDQPPV